MKDVSPSAMDKFFADASRQGKALISSIHCQVDYSAGCSAPITAEYRSSEDVIVWAHRRWPKQKFWRFHGGASHLNSKFKDPPIQPVRRYATVLLSCRCCDHCLRRRARLWRSRCHNELLLATRSWFCTFTVSPYNRVKIDILASRQLLCGDVDFDLRHKVISKEITKYFKRLRKNTGAKLRFICVAEQHKDGWPHYHALVHELGTNVTKRQLEREWLLGFTSFKLVSPFVKGVEGYICKYIAKQALARIRASLRYGTPCGIAKRDLLTPSPHGARPDLGRSYGKYLSEHLSWFKSGTDEVFNRK